MRDSLFVLSRFAHNAQSILAAVQRPAFVAIERGFNGLFGITPKLGTTTFTYAEHRLNVPHDPKFAPSHGSQSNASAQSHGMPVNFKRHHYRRPLRTRGTACPLVPLAGPARSVSARPHWLARTC
jgi:hypothetical protein